MDNAHAVPLTQPIITKGHRGHVSQAGDHSVAERAGDELTMWLDQRHLGGGVSTPDVLRASRAAEAATNDYDSSVDLRPRPAGQ
jgi:hypothetical protein